MIVIAGPCVIESQEMTLEIAQELKRQLLGLPIEFYFKASFDKANRSAVDGFRGPGLTLGLEMLAAVKAQTGLSVLTDFHSVKQAEPVAEVVDVLQLPAFLCRQTDLVVAGAQAALRHQRRLNIKKGQFLAPWDVQNIVDKVLFTQRQLDLKPSRPDWLTLTERGVSFGYQQLVVDMMSFPILQRTGYPVIYDATHSVQRPGAGPDGKSSGGRRSAIESLARAAMAAGANGVFLECHPDPKQAKSDAATALPLEKVGALIRQLLCIHDQVAKLPLLFGFTD